MPLVVFDVEGTLIDCVAGHDACLEAALTAELGVRAMERDRTKYARPTAAGFASEVMSRTYGTELGAAETKELRTRFLAVLRGAVKKSPELFQAVPGAAGALARAQSMEQWRAATASSTWSDAAGVLMASARVGSGVTATCDDSPCVEQVVTRAILRTVAASQRGEGGLPEDASGAEIDPGPVVERARRLFGSVVYVGDQPWDVRAADRLGIGFVGVRARGDFDALRGAGAAEVLAGLTDLAGFVSAVGRVQK